MMMIMMTVLNSFFFREIIFLTTLKNHFIQTTFIKKDIIINQRRIKITATKIITIKVKNIHFLKQIIRNNIELILTSPLEDTKLKGIIRHKILRKRGWEKDKVKKQISLELSLILCLDPNNKGVSVYN
jgi:hypothetical protein